MWWLNDSGMDRRFELGGRKTIGREPNQVMKPKEEKVYFTCKAGEALELRHQSEDVALITNGLAAKVDSEGRQLPPDLLALFPARMPIPDPPFKLMVQAPPAPPPRARRGKDEQPPPPPGDNTPAKR